MLFEFGGGVVFFLTGDVFGVATDLFFLTGVVFGVATDLSFLADVVFAPSFLKTLVFVGVFRLVGVFVIL